MLKNRFQLIIICVLFVCLLGGVFLYFTLIKEKNISKDLQSGRRSIQILWAKWPPADYLQKLSDDFTKETGIEVKIVQESWGTWQQIFFEEMAKKGQTYDMVIGDSQWLGRGATGGHYIELTQWIKKNGVLEAMTPASITGYAEFPKESGHYWAVPVEGDAMGFSYRKDLFEDPGERAAFQKQYSYPLAIPETWDQLKDIAEFFYRPEKDFYGILVWVEPKYDGITMGIQALIWSFGADLGDPRNYRVKGILNSDAGIQALKFYKDLNKYNNPDWVNNYLDTNSNSNQPMMDGKVAMAMGYFAITPELLDPQKNRYADSIGFFATPRGPKDRICSLGGQGISIISYTKKKKLCLKYLKWFVQDAVQEKWAELGGLSCHQKVLASEKFLNASPINRPFKESIQNVKDFWAVPEYPQLLAVSQKYFSDFVLNNTSSAEATMNQVAEKWEKIFEYAGYYKE